jgi:hypothetical protein
MYKLIIIYDINFVTWLLTILNWENLENARLENKKISKQNK